MKRKLLLSGALAAAALIGISIWAQRRSAEEGEARILALGDSYTIALGVAESERWTSRLAEALRNEGISVARPWVWATTGWTTQDLYKAAVFDWQEGQKRCDLVTLLIGVNDQFRGGDAETYRDDFRKMLQKAIHCADGKESRVIVISIPDWSVTPFAKDRNPEEIAAAIARFNRVNREESAKANVRYVDITPASREAARDPKLLAPDGLHPSGAMYQRWTELILPLAKAALMEAEEE